MEQLGDDEGLALSFPPEKHRQITASKRDQHEHADLEPHGDGERCVDGPENIGNVEHVSEGRDQEAAAEGEKQRRARDDQDVERGELRGGAPRDVHDRRHQQQVEHALEVEEIAPERALVNLGVRDGRDRDRGRQRKSERRNQQVQLVGVCPRPNEHGGQENGHADGQPADIDPTQQTARIQHGLHLRANASRRRSPRMEGGFLQSAREQGFGLLWHSAISLDDSRRPWFLSIADERHQDAGPR